MTKKSFCLSIEEKDYNTFSRLAKDKLSSVSREVNLFMRKEIKSAKEVKNNG